MAIARKRPMLTTPDVLNFPSARQAELDALVLCRGVGVSFGGREVLSGIDLAIAPGEIVTIIGPNGGGKTTLLKVVLGLISPDAGQVTRRAGLKIGYVPQKLQLDRTMPMTVRRLMTLTRRHSDPELLAALGETGVPHLIEADPTNLSGGEFQRVLIARALLSRPDLLVLDEPVRSVDFSGEASLYEKIAEIRSRHGCAILLVSHDLHVVMAATDRVVCLNRHVCCAGVPNEVAAAPEYISLFGPRAAGAMAFYSHHHDHTHSLEGDVVEANHCSCGRSLGD